ncbi:MAG: SSI family serine proteinase inhibitor [Gaiellaceae bacterium]
MQLLAVALAVLQITVWPQGTADNSVQWTLRCGPAAGSLPHAGRACLALAERSAAFRPTPPRVACSDIYGGPQVARVTGRYRGSRVFAVFHRRDGCEIARWNRLQALFPVSLRA